MDDNVIKVKPWGKDQGDYVLINESDFDEKKHEKYEEPSPPKVSESQTKPKGK